MPRAIRSTASTRFPPRSLCRLLNAYILARIAWSPRLRTVSAVGPKTSPARSTSCRTHRIKALAKPIAQLAKPVTMQTLTFALTAMSLVKNAKMRTNLIVRSVQKTSLSRCRARAIASRRALVATTRPRPQILVRLARHHVPTAKMTPSLA